MTSYEQFQTNQSFRYQVIGKLVKQGYIFHGTNKKFDDFDSNKIKGGSRGREGYGVYFTNEAYKAEEYGNEFMILSTKGMNIVNSKNTFSQLNITPPNEVKSKIEILKNQLDYVRNNRDYNAINDEIEKYENYLNNKLLLGVDYTDYQILYNYDFKPLSNNASIYNALSFAYNKLSTKGMESISKILLNIGIDGYIIDNVYVIINFKKLNNNIVKDKESLINNTINENKMKKTVSLNKKDINEMVETIVSKILSEELHNVVHKEGDVWKIKGHKGKGDNEKDGDWKADYKSKESAEAALRGYFAQKEGTEKTGKKIEEGTHSMNDSGDEQSTLLKEVSRLCDFGSDMLEKGNVTSVGGVFIQIKELVHKLYLSNKDNEIYSY